MPKHNDATAAATRTPPHPEDTMDPSLLSAAYADLLHALARTEPRALSRAAGLLAADFRRCAPAALECPGAVLAERWLVFAGAQLVGEHDAREAAGRLFRGVIGELVEMDGDSFIFEYKPPKEDAMLMKVEPVDHGERVRCALRDANGEWSTWLGTLKVRG